MNRIDELFIKLKSVNKKGFIAYITAGDPTIEFTSKLVGQMENCGVHLIEIGVPFSDPLADGPVIQNAMCRSLENYTNLDDIFAMIKNARKTTQIPIILFSYLNPLYQYGVEKFAEKCKESGVDGALILDLLPEESNEYCETMDKYGLATVFIIAPTTPVERIKLISKRSKGFIYYVSRTGVTGERDTVNPELHDRIEQIKTYTDKPIAIGFGISTPDHVKTVSSYADAVVVGSAIVKRIGKFGDNPDKFEELNQYIKDLTKPLV